MEEIYYREAYGIDYNVRSSAEDFGDSDLNGYKRLCILRQI